ncbi:putative rRNA methyltransferase YqxC [Propionispora sp. 2/2-37]|uniref:TlyA family RNA methyltransferase n=1 Tax=Propionispora sp. 2/2-37 TaxID=1677858 RepID=UPI0006BB6EAC|nr:TlyA family RNA methyltransferase [Propionispora sp. 2/2-37]CUH94290.1 putative rRNA methyltransferase YqxC [Propionispora sp. 2/2-37]
MNKERLDVLLTTKGLSPSRERAKASIMAGLVFVNDRKVDKAGTVVPTDAKIEIRGDSIGYVSRGGLKLAKALQVFSIQLENKTMADIGASTGGFTDCALKNGAARVYAIDVGYGQLAWSLRMDERVINMERTNVRNVTLEMVGELLDFISIDVAFISLSKVLPVVSKLLAPHGSIVALIKPQFEAGREKVGKKGVVRDAKVHLEVISNVAAFARELSLIPQDLTFSPIKGPEGNIEYLIYLTRSDPSDGITTSFIHNIVTEAHAYLL